MAEDSNGWIRHEKLIAAVLDRHDKELQIMTEKIVKIRLEMESLKAKASLIGAIAGAVVSAGATYLSRG